MKERVCALALVLVIAATACSKSDQSPTGGTQGGSTGATPTASLQVISAGQLTIGSCLDFPPFDSLEGDQPTGFDVELLNAIAAKLGLEPVFVKTNFDTIFTSVASGKFDVASSGITITPERQQVVAFTIPYFTTEISLTVNTSQTPEITSIDGLKKGDVVGTQKGSTDLIWAQENLAPKGIEIKTYGDFPSAYLDLQAGRLAGVVDDAISAVGEIATRPELKIVESVTSGENWGFAIPNDNPELKAAMDQAIQELFADGTYASLFQKYLPGIELPAGLPTG
jgi:polar amino acid transport system substrate-binding protein